MRTVDDLVIVTSIAPAEWTAKLPRALVAVLIAAAVIPSRALFVGDRFIVLVARDIDGRIRIVVVRVLARIASRRGGVGVWHISVENDIAAAANPTVISTVLGEGATAPRAGADPLRRIEEEQMSRTRRPAVRRDRLLDFGLDLRVAQADARVGITAAARRKRAGVRPRCAEGRAIEDFTAGVVIVLGIAVVNICRRPIGGDILQKAVDETHIVCAYRVTLGDPVDGIGRVGVHRRAIVVNQIAADWSEATRLPVRGDHAENWVHGWGSRPIAGTCGQCGRRLCERQEEHRQGEYHSIFVPLIY